MDLYLYALWIIVPLVWYFLKKKTQYWRDRKVPYVNPDLLLGNLRGVTTECHVSERWRSCYNQLKGKGSPIGGVFFFTEPVALALDLDLLRDVFVKDFSYFRNHGIYVNARDDPLSAHLFSLEDDQWKSLRTKLTPTFTSGKMKSMFPTMKAVADQFKDHLKEITTINREVEFKELLSQFSTDIIGSTAFGIECNTMKDPNGDLRETAKLIFGPSKATTAKLLLLNQFPKLGLFLRMKLIDERVTTFFMKLIKDIVVHRETTKVQRNDFMALLLQIKNTGRLDGHESDLGKMSFNEFAAQVFLFFFAGYETSSSTLTFAMYELAKNPNIQERARQDIHAAIKRHGGCLTYEAVMELTYIDQIICESLRKYPIVDTLFRKLAENYKVPNTEVVLEKGSTFIISVLGIHRDPSIYHDPETFNPDRFTKENVAARHPYAWIPFGKGPRECIGMRFGMMQARLGLITVLDNFRVLPSSTTPEQLEFVKNAQVLAPIGGMPLVLERLHN